MTKLATILDRAGIDRLGVLDADITIPTLCGVQAQGDLLILPRPNKAAATTPIPQTGVEVVRAEQGGNTHTLLSMDGPGCYWDAADTRSGVVLGTLTVPAGASAYLVHSEEHGANAVGAGTYEIRRQREQADEIRMVAD